MVMESVIKMEHGFWHGIKDVEKYGYDILATILYTEPTKSIRTLYLEK
jgi:hypothetical protein